MKLKNSILSALIIPNSIKSIYELGGYKLTGQVIYCSFEDFKSVLKSDNSIRQLFDNNNCLNFQNNSTLKFIFIRSLCFMQLFEISKALEENKKPSLYTTLSNQGSNEPNISDMLCMLDKIHNLKQRGKAQVIVESKYYTNPYITFTINGDLPKYLKEVVDKMYRMIGFISLLSTIQKENKTICNLHRVSLEI